MHVLSVDYLKANHFLDAYCYNILSIGIYYPFCYNAIHIIDYFKTKEKNAFRVAYNRFC